MIPSPLGSAAPGGADIEDDDEEDDEAFNALIEMLRASETPGPQKRPPPHAAAGGAPPQAAAPRSPSPPPRDSKAPRSVDTGEEGGPKRGKSAVEYEYNPASQRWEPAKQKPEPAFRARPAASAPQAQPAVSAPAAPGGAAAYRPRFPGSGGAAQWGKGQQAWGNSAAGGQRPPQGGYAHHRGAQGSGAQEDGEPRKNYLIAECEAEARADEARGLCEYPQALAVRLALRFESRPAAILSIMGQAGLPAAKDQRSTVKAIMRLCHPDKCKHPDAKRAMQILIPLLT